MVWYLKVSILLLKELREINYSEMKVIMHYYVKIYQINHSI
jgi:hypothetical protein